VYKPANAGWTIIGVSSFTAGPGCGAGPGGFARVTSILGWLERVFTYGWLIFFNTFFNFCTLLPITSGSLLK
jgi:hypothetical protein